MGKTSDALIGLTLSMDSAVATITVPSAGGSEVYEVGRIGFPPGAISMDGVADMEVVVDALRELWSRIKIPASRGVAVSINHPGVTIQLTTVPIMPERDLGPVLHGIAEGYGVFEGAEIVSDWALIEEIRSVSSSKMNALLVAAKQQLVSSLLSAVHAAGLEVEVADILPAAIMRLVYPKVVTPEPVSVVMVTDHVSYIWIFQQGKLKISYTANIGQSNSHRQARSLADLGNSGEGAAARLPNELTKELRNCFRFFHTEYHPQRISKVLLVAGGDRTSDAIAMSADLGLPVEALGTADFMACNGDIMAAAGTVDAMGAIGASVGLRGSTSYPLSISLAPRRRRKLIGALDILLGSTSLAAVIAAGILLSGNISHKAALKYADAGRDKAATAEVTTKISVLEEELKLRNFRSEAVKAKIEELQKTQSVRLSQVISEIAERKPQGLWLESVGTDAGKLIIKGTCTSNDVYANFIDNLSASPLVEWVTPSSIQRDSTSGLFEFEITGKVIGASAPAASENKKDTGQ